MDCKEINKSVLKEFNLEYLLERLMLKLKLQYFGYLIQSADSLKYTLRLGKIEGKRRGGQPRKRELESITESMDMCFSKLREMMKDRHGMLEYMISQRVRHD